MKAQRVYIDTSVLGGCFDPEFARWWNALMADFHSGRLKPVISEIITAEIADAPPEVRELLADLLALTPETLDITPEVLALADAYQEHGIIDAQVLRRWVAYRPCDERQGRSLGQLELPAYRPL